MSMSSTSPSISGLSPDHGNFRIEKKKRNRVPVSCGPCRNRKLRCNRQSPCENCIKRNDIDGCSYASSCTRRRRVQMSGSFSSSDEMQSRIDRLEGLVIALMHSKPEHSISGSDSSVIGRRHSSVGRGKLPHVLAEDEDDEFDYEEDAMVTDTVSMSKENRIKPDPDAQVEEVRHALGVMQVGKGASYFRGETHINTILQEISEIKAFYQQTKEHRSLNAVDHAETFPFAAGIRLSKEELIEIIPPRAIVDIVLENYFTWHDPLFHVIHKPGFFREYEEFWKNPQAVDPLWLALLFITMHQSWKLFAFSGNGPSEYQSSATDLSIQYRHASEAALMVGEFTKRKSYHYNALRTLYLMCASGSYGPDHTWLLLGWVVRIAMVMGLHRDGEQYKLPPFEIEIRRRLWTSLLCMDYVYSIQIGLPPMIRNMDFDTQLPHNLHDKELTEDLDNMPTPNPYTTKTDITYLIFKVRLIRTYGEIVAHANAIGPRPAYDEVMKLDAELRTTFSCLPEYFRLQKPANMTAAPPASQTQPLLLEFLYHKAIVTLHRPYASKARTNPKYNYSRKELIGSCIAMMNHQLAMRQFEDARLKLVRYITCGLASYDFVHAAISLCVDVWECAKAGELEAQHQLGEVNPRAIIEVLELARSQYNPEKAGADPNSQKAHEIICTVLENVYALRKIKTRPHDQQPYSDSENAGSSPSAGTPETPHSIASTQLETPQKQTLRRDQHTYSNAHIDTPIKSEAGTGGVPNGGLYKSASPPQSENATSPPFMTGLLAQDIPGSLNWDEWDSFMQGINLDPTAPNSDWWQSIPAPPQLYNFHE